MTSATFGDRMVPMMNTNLVTFAATTKYDLTPIVAALTAVCTRTGDTIGAGNAYVLRQVMFTLSAQKHSRSLGPLSRLREKTITALVLGVFAAMVADKTIKVIPAKKYGVPLYYMSAKKRWS